MRVLVTGSTTWREIDAIRREFASLPSDSVIITGDTPGVDFFAQEAAIAFGFRIEAMKKQVVDCDAHPNEGWKGLNERILATGIDLVLAFHPDYGLPGCANGTRHAVELAEKASIQVRVFRR